ncbi:MAG: hypothetical protein J3K34DRAFT_155824 [Monoraphidium minutum]|nr:MAG: hypothetical protein J3K34DRAFT_155824 [Monoraphidium minutum]
MSTPGMKVGLDGALMMLFTFTEVAIVALLVAPMPSNKMRGQVTAALNKLWTADKYVQRTFWVMLTLNSYYLVDSVRSLVDHNKIYAAATCESRAMALWIERNAWMSGSAVFLFFVMRRVLDIQAQLFEMRGLVKKATGGGGGGGSPRAAGGGEAAKAALRQLDRAVSRVMGEEEAAAAARKLRSS